MNMRVALDIDETITRCPELFAVLSRGLLREDHEVYVITKRFERLREKTIKQLTEWGIEYTALFMDESKHKLCEKLGIDVIFEDKPNEIKKIKPPTVVFMTVNEKNFPR